MNKVEGWTNYATWSVALWVNNDYGLYQAKEGFLRDDPDPVTEENVRFFVEEYMQNTTPDLPCDREGGRFEDINWSELAESFETDRLEMLEDDKRYTLVNCYGLGGLHNNITRHNAVFGWGSPCAKSRP